jgi:hypothetical protein
MVNDAMTREEWRSEGGECDCTDNRQTRQRPERECESTMTHACECTERRRARCSTGTFSWQVGRSNWAGPQVRAWQTHASVVSGRHTERMRGASRVCTGGDAWWPLRSGAAANAVDSGTTALANDRLRLDHSNGCMHMHECDTSLINRRLDRRCGWSRSIDHSRASSRPCGLDAHGTTPRRSPPTGDDHDAHHTPHATQHPAHRPIALVVPAQRNSGPHATTTKWRKDET